MMNHPHGQTAPSHSANTLRLVAWETTRRCNLACKHCRAVAEDHPYDNELDTQASFKLLREIREVGEPIIILTGGEPLLRHDIFDIAAFGTKIGLRMVMAPNGTLITKDKAKILKEIGLSYVGISLDGLEETHDLFRGVKGSYQKALAAIENCKDAGIKVGLRFTINKRNVKDIPGIFDLLEEKNIPRACFYHLVYSGRGSEIAKEDLSHEETRKVLDLIMDRDVALTARFQPVVPDTWLLEYFATTTVDLAADADGDGYSNSIFFFKQKTAYEMIW